MPADPQPTGQPRLALVQRAIEPSRDAAHRGAVEAVRAAAAGGARIVCLPELYDLPYFPRQVTVEGWRLAERQPSDRVRELG
ncbi:MAG: hypothetical protein F4Z74_07570, partial [Acidobacteria bacterium]|nr:hypothetical protein [Acidobacteriota bacterium]